MGNDALSADKVSASTLMQLAAADILNDRNRVTGREGMSEGLVEPLICKFPIRILRSWLGCTCLSLILNWTLTY